MIVPWRKTIEGTLKFPKAGLAKAGLSLHKVLGGGLMLFYLRVQCPGAAVSSVLWGMKAKLGLPRNKFAASASLPRPLLPHLCVCNQSAGGSQGGRSFVAALSGHSILLCFLP